MAESNCEVILVMQAGTWQFTLGMLVLALKEQKTDYRILSRGVV